MVNTEGLLDSALLSLEVAVAVMAIDLVLGVPACITLVRQKVRGTALLVRFLQSPVMIPGIVIGISLLFMVSYVGGNASVPLMIVSHVVVTIPFVIRITYARMQSADKNLEDAARNLRANSWQVFRNILGPYLMPAIVGSSAFVFISSWDNIPVSLFTSPIVYPPLPIFLLRLMLYNVNPMLAAVATVQILITLAVMAIVAKSVGVMQAVGVEYGT